MATDPYQYLEGFHNHHTSEALPNSLPKGMYALDSDLRTHSVWINSDTDFMVLLQARILHKNALTICMPSSSLGQLLPCPELIISEGELNGRQE